MRRTDFTDGRCMGQCVPSMKISPPSDPDTIFLKSSLVGAAATSSDMLSAVGSIPASIASITGMYRDTVVWSIPRNAASTPWAGLSFLRISARSSACLRYSLHRFPGSEAGMRYRGTAASGPNASETPWPAPACTGTVSPSASVTWRSLSPSRIMPSSTSSRCNAGPLPGFQPSFLLFHRPRSRPNSLSFCSSFLSFCFRIFFRVLSFCFRIFFRVLSFCSSFLSFCSSFLSFCSSFLSFCSSFLSFCSSFLSFCFRIFV